MAGDDRPTFTCGGSVFNTGGQRLNEIDQERPMPTKIGDYTTRDWAAAEAALCAFDARHR